MAVQPIPFADIFVLTPIQVVMVVLLNKILGGPVSSSNPKELVAYITGVVSWGVLAQQIILGLYKSVLPFMAGYSTIPLVYAANTGLGYAAKTILEARLRDQEIPKEEIKRLAEQARKNAASEKRDWSLSAIQKELANLKESAEYYALYEEELKSLNLEQQKLRADYDRVLRENVELSANSVPTQLSDREIELKAELQEMREKKSMIIKKTI